MNDFPSQVNSIQAPGNPGDFASANPRATVLAGEGASFSVRPQNITLRRDGDAPGKWCIPGRLEERAYLGEYWEYEVRTAGSEIRLRVNASPDDMHAVGEDIWMEIDPERIAPVPAPDGD